MCDLPAERLRLDEVRERALAVDLDDREPLTVLGRENLVAADVDLLERIAELVTSGAVKLPEIKVYPLSEAADAHRVSEGRHLRGKLVFKIR